jgi:hypothetical protein
VPIFRIASMHAKPISWYANSTHRADFKVAPDATLEPLDSTVG